jgi:pimeloyl-ACP methyl ester carboxylesterase
MAAVKGFQEHYQQIGDTLWHLHETTAAPADTTHTVVFVPGLGEGDYMAPHARLLAEHWRVLILDMPGFGRTRAPNRLRTVEAFGQALTGYLRMGLDKPAYVVGSSFGCQIAAAAAERDAPVDRMVMVSPTYDRRARSIPAQLRRWIPTMLVEPPMLALGLAKSYAHCGVRTPIIAFLAGLYDPLEQRLAQIEIPVLVVRGARDHIVSAEWAAEVAAQLPRSRLATIEGFAHTLDYAAPEPLAAVTVPFLRDSQASVAKASIT